MIALDTSALMAVLLGETASDACAAVLEAEDQLVMSAGTLAEALIVAARRGVGEEMQSLIEGLGCEVIPLTAASARRVGQAYGRWGKGVHPAGLNLGDCFAYELAREQGCRLLFVGNDFSRTDIAPALKKASGG